MADMLALPFVPLAVGEFLDFLDLAACETAQLFNPNFCEPLWALAKRRWLEGKIFWKAPPFLQGALQSKKVMADLVRYRRTVLVSSLWSPWVTETSFCSIAATPHAAAEKEGISRERQRLVAKPHKATLLVAVGQDRGTALVAGMKFSGTGPVNDSLCFSIVGKGPCLCCQSVVISFAPFSGKCFIQQGEITMQILALPQVCQYFPYMEGTAWCHVTEEGSVQFLRQFKGGPIEDTGLIPHHILHRAIEYYFPAIQVWLSDLEADINVSVEHTGEKFPGECPVSSTCVFEIGTTWWCEIDTSLNPQR